MDHIFDCHVAVAWNGRSYSGLYSHVEGVLTVTAFGSSIEKLQRIVWHSGDPEDRARSLLIAMVETGKVDPDS